LSARVEKGERPRAATLGRSVVHTANKTNTPHPKACQASRVSDGAKAYSRKCRPGSFGSGFPLAEAATYRGLPLAKRATYALLVRDLGL